MIYTSDVGRVAQILYSRRSLIIILAWNLKKRGFLLHYQENKINSMCRIYSRARLGILDNFYLRREDIYICVGEFIKFFYLLWIKFQLFRATEMGKDV